MRTYKQVFESGFNIIYWNEGNTNGYFKEGQDLYSEAMATGKVVMQTQDELDTADRERVNSDLDSKIDRLVKRSVLLLLKDKVDPSPENTQKLNDLYESIKEHKRNQA